MFKKIIFALTLVMCFCASANAQENQVPFEGEIVYETYENYSDYLKKMGNSIMFDGVHKVRVIVKGSKMHMIDETTKCHTIADADVLAPLAAKADKNAQNGYIHFCDLTKTGMDLTKMSVIANVLSPNELFYPDGTKATVSSYTFAKTDKTENILNEECCLYQGDINHVMGGMDQKYNVKAYVSNIPAPSGYKYANWGLETPGIVTKWIQKFDGGHVSIMNVGELSYYMEIDVVELKPRKVSDEEFVIPSDYKISKSSSNAFALMKYYKGIRKQLEKNGIKGGDNNQKKTGVHYKTDGEWDF